jgi:nucleoside-diphosphate-sugar epimerase
MPAQAKMILITGASGQLGRRLIRELIKRGYRVRAHYRSREKAKKYCPDKVQTVFGDMLEKNWLDGAVKDATCVIHCAARVSVRPLSEADTDYMYKVNVTGTQNLIEACRRAGVERLIYMSSIAAVGASEDGEPIDEKAPFNLDNYNMPYFNTKHEAEELALKASDSNMAVISLAPSIMISPPDRELTENDLKKIPKRIPAYFQFGLNLVETGDVIDGIISALDKGKAGERYLLTGDNVDPQKLFAIAKKYLNIKKPLIRIPLWLVYIVGAIAELAYIGRNKRPKLNRQIAKLAKLKFYYNCDKAKRDLDYNHKTLEQTVEQILQKINLQK